MKKILFIISLLLTSLLSYSQFQQCASPTTQNLWDICFVDESQGVAVGDSGTILRSLDGGLNWDQVFTADSIHLRKVKFFNTQHAIAIGTHVLSTNDGGLNWSVQNFNNDFFYDIEILNDSTCLISGSPTALYKSTDHGSSWEILINQNTDENFGILSFVDENLGYSCKGNGSGSIFQLLKTTDGGISWTTIEIESGIGNTVIEDLSFVTESTGFKCGWYESHLTKTMDSGINWEYPAVTDSTLYVQLRDFHIDKDQSNAYYACGWYGTLIKSVDGGNTWFEMSHGFPMENEIFYGIYFLDESLGWIVGSNGIILKTNNGGGPTRISESQNKLNIQLYPNPTSGKIFIDMPKGLGISTILVMNFNGQNILEVKDSELLQLEDFPKGIYIVTIETDKGNFTQKIIVK